MSEFSRRDMFAAAALQGMLAAGPASLSDNDCIGRAIDPDEDVSTFPRQPRKSLLVQWAKTYADEMVKQIPETRPRKSRKAGA